LKIVTIYNIGGSGCFLYASYDAHIINSDAWNCSDPFGDQYLPNPSPGNDGYGFTTNNGQMTHNKLYIQKLQSME